jgi:hypothetical protein
MFFFTFVAHPKPHHAEYGAVDGAYVACWVAEPLESVAEGIAREAIEAQQWDVDERDEGYPVSIDDYELGSESRERCEQAAVDGVVLTFHRWPVGAPDEE